MDDALKTRLVAIALIVSSAAFQDGDAFIAFHDDGVSADHRKTVAGDWCGGLVR